MSEHPLEEVKEKFDAALSLSVKERELYLQQLSTESTQLHHQVADLLAKHEVSNGNDLTTSLRSFNTEAKLAETIGIVLPTIDMKSTVEDPGSLATLSAMVEIPETPFIGEIGDYQLIEQIGRGGMGVVYKAYQKKVGRTVALKVIASGSLCAPEDIARFRDEASAAGRLSHPGIVAVYDAGEHNGTHYFSMAYIEGDTLGSYVGANKPRLAPRRAAKLMEDVCRAVQYAHDRAVIHRDIKPANIMPDKSGQPLLTDFGLAKLIGNEGHTQTGQVMGTPNYMAPEQAKGDQDAISNRTDVYSLGATLYALLSGAPAFAGKNLIETLRKVESAAPEPLTYKGSPVPLDLWIICEKCLAKRPEDRYESATALADDLQRYLQGFPISARAVGPWTRLQRWSQRNPVIATLLGTVAATLVIATIVSISFAVQARAEKIRAEENLAFIESVLERALISVSEEDLSNEPGTQKVRERLLNIAQEYYKQLSATQQISASKVANAAFLLGRVKSSLGLDKQAQESLQEALKIQTELLPAAEDKVEALTNIAATHKELSRLGEKLWNNRGVDAPSAAAKEALLASIEHSSQCVDYRQQAFEAKPADQEIKRLLASAKLGLGVALIQQGRWNPESDALQKSERVLAEAQREWTQLLSESSENPKLLRDVAYGYVAVADLRESQANPHVESNPAKYEELLRESLKLRKEAAHKFESLPAAAVNSATRSLLATCYQMCAESHYLLGMIDESVSDYERSLAVMRQLLMSNPLVYDYRVGVAQTQFNLAQIHFSRGDDRGFQSAYEFQQTLVDGLAIDPQNHKAIDLLLEFTASLSDSFVQQELFQEALNQLEQVKTMLTNMQILESDKPLIDSVVEKLERKAAELREQINSGDRTT